MKVLTVKQPWAHAIRNGEKDVENRSWSTEYRGPVAIHAGQSFDDGYEDSYPVPAVGFPLSLTRGAVIAVVDLVNVHRGHAPTESSMTNIDSCFQAGKPFGPCSVWAQPHNFHWVLANPRRLTVPLPLTGGLGLRDLDPDVEARIIAALEGTRS
jgi:hypothetical protein